MKNTRFATVAIAAFAATLVAGCHDEFGGAKANYYVSPKGDDSAEGTSAAHPFRTLARARDAARARAGAGVAVVALADGVYEAYAQLEFTHDDHDLVFAAAPGARPVVSAGRRISGWKVGGDGVWRAAVPSGERFSQFYVNGQRRQRPFLPRKGYYYVKSGHEPDPATGEARFVARQGEFPAGDNPGLEVCMFHTWTMSRSHVRSDSATNRVVTLGVRNFVRDWEALGSSRWYRYDNVKTAFGEPGDWYLDESAWELAYMPMPGERPESCDAVASHFVHVARFSGVTNVVWRGVTFAYADYGVQTNGNYTGQAASGQPGAVHAERSKGIRLENCAVVHTGAHGVRFDYGSEDCVVVGCELRDLGAGGVMIGDGHPKGRKIALCRRCEVRDCLIAGGGRVDPAGCGVWIGHATDNVVSHNTIHDMYYTGVSLGWNWWLTITARDNLIEWNHIYDIGRHRLSDMGGIYLLGSQPGTVERCNYIHHVTRARNCAFGIYFDSGSSFVTVTNNVVHDCEDSNFFLAAISCSNRVENNVFACGPSRQIHALSRNPKSSPSRFARNLVAWDDGVVYHGLPGPESIVLEDNLYWCPEENRPKTAPRGGKFAEIPFADLAHRDLRITSETAALRGIGFVPFSLEGCGRSAPPRLTAGMPEVPDVFFEAPEPILENVDETFESVPVGAAFPGWSVLGPDGTNVVRVTDKTAATGSRSLEVIDKSSDWKPHVYRSIYRTKGKVCVSFALRVEGGASPRVELRGGGKGPCVRVMPDGTVMAWEEKLTKVPLGEWCRYEIEMELGRKRARHAYSLAVVLPGGERRVFADLPLEKRFTAFHWIGLHSCSGAGRYWFDDFKVTER